MELSFKCLPQGALPYTDEAQITRMMVRLFEAIPYLPFLPNISESKNILERTLGNVPCVVIKEDEIYLNDVSGHFISTIDTLDRIYSNPTAENLEAYKIETFYLDKYLQMLKRIKPAETVINLLGPFTAARLINSAGISPLADKIYRKFIIQAITIKALWFINKVKECSPKTTPIIIFEEPRFNEYGVVKKQNESITRELVVNMFSKIFQGIHSAGAIVGVQSFKKCDWQIPIDAGVDIISIDAYNNSGNLVIVADKVQEFLERGGFINWGIVPVQSENLIKSLSVEKIYEKFVFTTGSLIAAGVERELLYNNMSVSIQGDVSNYSIFFAEKALMISSKLVNRAFFR